MTCPRSRSIIFFLVLLKKAAMKLQWAALLAKDLTESGSRNSVVVVVVVVVGDLIS